MAEVGPLGRILGPAPAHQLRGLISLAGAMVGRVRADAARNDRFYYLCIIKENTFLFKGMLGRHDDR